MKGNTENRAKTTVVLLHGWMMSRRCWDDVAARLQKHFHLFIAELPGHDARGGDGGGSFARPGELVAALAAAAPRRALWVGWSLGGMLAQAVACRYPERVAGLVCIAAPARFVANEEWPHGMAQTVFDDFATSFARDADGTARRFLALQAAGAGDAGAVLRRLKKAAAPATGHTELAAALRFLGGSDLRRALRDCRCRADFIGGGRDRLVTARAVEQSSRLARHGRFHGIADAGHAALISHPGRVCEVIEQCAEQARAVP